LGECWLADVFKTRGYIANANFNYLQQEKIIKTSNK